MNAFSFATPEDKIRLLKARYAIAWTIALKAYNNSDVPKKYKPYLADTDKIAIADLANDIARWLSSHSEENIQLLVNKYTVALNIALDTYDQSEVPVAYPPLPADTDKIAIAHLAIAIAHEL